MVGWVRKGAGLLAGVVAAGACVAGFEAAAHALLPRDAVFAAAASGLGPAAFVGGALGSWIGRSTWIAWAVGALLGALALVNVVSFPHPGWFVPVAALALVAGAWAAGRLRHRTVA